MNHHLNVLIVDDHPIILNLYKLALEKISSNNTNITFKINTAIDCETADLEIKKAKKGSPLDLVLLDISLPPSSNCKLLSGDDLGYKIKQSFHNTKLIVITAISNNHKLCNIFKSLNPDGFLIKSDFDFIELMNAITSVIKDIPYYSKTVTRLIRRHMSNEIMLDKTDREILYHLSKGARMKDLPSVVNLSIAGIEKRKRHLRDIFDTDRKNDRALIESAKEKGFI